MRGIHPRKRTVLLATLAVLAGAVCLIVAAPQRKPVQERMTLNDQPVIVDYKPAAESNDLGLPFYKGARVENSFSIASPPQMGSRSPTMPRRRWSALTRPKP